MGLRTVDFAAILLNLAYCAHSEHILPCNVSSPEPCPGENEVCVQQTGQCVCKAGFVFVDDNCAPEGTDTSSHTATIVIVSLFTLALLVCGIVLVFRKYDLLNHIRQRINLRRNNDVMYEDVMIGQDDPPLSP
ncbi:uncharacterized protein LOC135073426 [Ostrinia nubilalis]|uniref:uncharacterized protein LOC114362499 n=1 Tax=Ostrinia furnacalis TaxID=93504 RepID=UPI0010408A04|nr:uncharacterized protein LOC114362499 [Ostrinia furnacalis]XP_028173735.1 uncharacterized protein LOC114362500 [Ostrinia furnacalis]